MSQGNMRIRYGLAFGRENNFYTGIAGQRGYLAGTEGLLAQAGTALDVTYGNLFYTNNSSATVLSQLNLQHPSAGVGSSNIAGLYEGKYISIFFLDSNTTLSGSRINLLGTDNTFGANSYLELLYHNSAWYELNRTNIYTGQVALNIAGSAAVNANYVTSYLLNGTGATNVVQSICNGAIGQRLLLINNNSTSTIQISTFGNIGYSFAAATYFPGSGGGLILSIAASGVCELVMVGGGKWSTVGR